MESKLGFLQLLRHVYKSSIQIKTNQFNLKSNTNLDKI